jgi:hypothetical protein
MKIKKEKKMEKHDCENCTKKETCMLIVHALLGAVAPAEKKYSAKS